MSEDMGAKIIGCNKKTKEFKNDKDFDKTVYILNSTREALQSAEGSLACTIKVIQCAIETIKLVEVAVEAAKQRRGLSQQDDEMTRVSVSEDFQCSPPCQGNDDNDSQSAVSSNADCDDMIAIIALASASRLIQASEKQVKLAKVVVEAAMQFEKARASIMLELQCSTSCQGNEEANDNDSTDDMGAPFTFRDSFSSIGDAYMNVKTLEGPASGMQRQNSNNSIQFNYQDFEDEVQDM